MSLNSTNIQYVDAYYKYIVSGFIHHLEKTNSVHCIIPDIVFGITLLFYYDNEFFMKCGKDMDITSTDVAKQKHNVVTLRNNYHSGIRYGPHSNTAYGNIIINTHKFPNSIYKWVLSVNMSIHIESTAISCLIGIHSSSGVFDTEYNAYSRFMAEKNSIYFAREVTVGARSDRDKLIRNDDQYIKTSVLYQNNVTKGIHQIEMILNTKDKTLQYIDNGVDLRVAFSQMYFQRQ
eukprot:776312_1